MAQKSKRISGFTTSHKRKVRNLFTKEEKHKILHDYLSSNFTKQEIWKKYTGEDQEHGYLLRWMRQLGYESEQEYISFASKESPMENNEIKKDKEQDSFENLQLKKRVEELEKQLKDAEMKAIAYSTMVDIAEEELKINIKKKYNTKP